MEWLFPTAFFVQAILALVVIRRQARDLAAWRRFGAQIMAVAYENQPTARQCDCEQCRRDRGQPERAKGNN